MPLTPGSSVDLVFRYRILSAGDIAFSTTVVGEDAIGRPVQAEGSVLDSVGGIEVEVGAAWPVPPGGGDTPAEFQADNNGDGTVDDADHVLTIEVTEKNLLDEPLTNVLRDAPTRALQSAHIGAGGLVSAMVIALLNQTSIGVVFQTSCAKAMSIAWRFSMDAASQLGNASSLALIREMDVFCPTSVSATKLRVR